MIRFKGITQGSRQPSVVALLFAIWALLIPMGYSNGLLSADGDLARHLVLGGHILENGPSFADVFSHTKPGETFLAYEWLSEVILALVHAVGGLAAVAVFAGLLIATSVAVVAIYLRHRVETALVLLVGNLVAVFTYPHWIARPHLFSFLGVALLLMVATRRPGGKRNLALGTLFLFWANLHPGFLYGLAILLAFLVGDTLDHKSRQRLQANVVSGLIAIVSTVANPFGIGLHRDIVRHLGDAEAFSLVEEFQALDLMSPYGLLFFACLSALVFVMAARNRRPPFSALLPFFAALFAALSVVRNVPLFALFALPLLLNSISDVIHRWHWKPLDRPRTVMSADDTDARTAPLVLVALLTLGVLLGLSGRVGSLQLVKDEFSTTDFPVAAVAEARAAGLSDLRMFNEYRWGGYILYAWPEQRIFIDGMANFFGGALMEEYLSLRYGLEGWQATLRDRGVEMLILPPDVPLVRSATDSPEWEVWYADSTAVVLRREKGLEPDEAESVIPDTVGLRPPAE